MSHVIGVICFEMGIYKYFFSLNRSEHPNTIELLNDTSKVDTHRVLSNVLMSS